MQNSRDESSFEYKYRNGTAGAAILNKEIVPTINENVMQNGITLFFSLEKEVLIKTISKLLASFFAILYTAYFEKNWKNSSCGFNGHSLKSTSNFFHAALSFLVEMKTKRRVSRCFTSSCNDSL